MFAHDTDVDGIGGREWAGESFCGIYDLCGVFGQEGGGGKIYVIVNGKGFQWILCDFIHMNRCKVYFIDTLIRNYPFHEEPIEWSIDFYPNE